MNKCAECNFFFAATLAVFVVAAPWPITLSFALGAVGMYALFWE